MLDYRFRLDLQVRDYECDMQGVVNNAVYQNYLEHCRHEFIKELGLDFAEVTRRGINLVVIRAELDYRHSLRSGDRFWIGLQMERISKLRFAYRQYIYLTENDRPVLNARVIGTGVNAQGRPELPAEIAAALDSAG